MSDSFISGMFSKNGFSSDVTNFYVDEIIYVDEEEFTKIRRTENVDTFKAYNEKTYEIIGATTQFKKSLIGSTLSLFKES